VAQEWVFRTTPTFRKQFGKLSPDQQSKARERFHEWKKDPFSQALGVHKINRLSALAKRPIRAIHVEKNLVVTFAVHGNEIVSLDIGTEKDVYG
jgi:hypothetical protein